MSKILRWIVFPGFCCAALAVGQNYTGTYTASYQGVTATLVLQQDAQGKITGTLSSTKGKGAQFRIEGNLEEGLAVGLCNSEDGAVYFEAELEGDKLRFSMFDVGENNNPDYSKAKNLEFVRQNAGTIAGQGAASSAQNPLAQKPIDPFVGTFSGQGLTLSLQATGGKYSGTFNFSGQTFPVAAQKKGGSSIEGTFESGGTEFSFSATLENNVMKLSTEGTQYTLKKQGGGQIPTQPPANPLQNQARGEQPAKGGAKAISDPQMGISFTPPAGWKAQKQASGYLLGSDTYRGLIIIMPHNYSSLQQMNAEAQEGIVDEGSGIQLQPVSGFQPVGKNGLAGEFSGMFQGQMARAFALGLISPNGGGVTIMAAVESGSYTKDYPQFVRTLAAGLSFIQPQPQGQGQGRGDSSLMNYFAGKYYSYSSGSTISGGAGTERQVMLCPNGQFYDSYEFSASGSDWGGANSQQGAARWSIQGTKSQGVITIIRPDGRAEQVPYQVAGEKGVIFFNGIKFAFAGAPECR